MCLSMTQAGVDLCFILLKYAFIKLNVNFWGPHEVYRENVCISCYRVIPALSKVNITINKYFADIYFLKLLFNFLEQSLKISSCFTLIKKIICSWSFMLILNSFISWVFEILCGACCTCNLLENLMLLCFLYKSYQNNIAWHLTMLQNILGVVIISGFPGLTTRISPRF